jgi:hypothetical protein
MDNKYRLLLDIHCLFDITLGCVADLYPNEIQRIIENGYHYRTHNFLSTFSSNINDDKVNERYKHRDVALLKKSRRSCFLDILALDIKATKGLDKDHPGYVDYDLTINTWPFKLSNGEIRELFILLSEILSITGIKRIHLSPEVLTVSYLKNKYDKIVIYDFNAWLECHYSVTVRKDCLEKIPLDNTIFAFPLICRTLDNLIKDDELEAAKDEIKQSFIGRTNVEVMDLDDFSIQLRPDILHE